MLKRVIGTATNLFPLWSVLTAVLALSWPASFMWFGKEAITWGLGIIMLGMGLTLTWADFGRIFQRPGSVFAGVILQFLVMPSLGWGIGQLLGLSPEMAAGLVLVSCCPGGTASNVVAYLARANVALSVTMTAFATLLAVVATPYLTAFLAGKMVPVDAWALLKSTYSGHSSSYFWSIHQPILPKTSREGIVGVSSGFGGFYNSYRRFYSSR